MSVNTINFLFQDNYYFWSFTDSQMEKQTRKDKKDFFMQTEKSSKEKEVAKGKMKYVKMESIFTIIS